MRATVRQDDWLASRTLEVTWRRYRFLAWHSVWSWPTTAKWESVRYACIGPLALTFWND